MRKPIVWQKVEQACKSPKRRVSAKHATSKRDCCLSIRSEGSHSHESLVTKDRATFPADFSENYRLHARMRCPVVKDAYYHWTLGAPPRGCQPRRLRRLNEGHWGLSGIWRQVAPGTQNEKKRLVKQTNKNQHSEKSIRVTEETGLLKKLHSVRDCFMLSWQSVF